MCIPRTLRLSTGFVSRCVAATTSERVAFHFIPVLFCISLVCSTIQLAAFAYPVYALYLLYYVCIYNVTLVY